MVRSARLGYDGAGDGWPGAPWARREVACVPRVPRGSHRAAVVVPPAAVAASVWRTWRGTVGRRAEGVRGWKWESGRTGPGIVGGAGSGASMCLLTCTNATGTGSNHGILTRDLPPLCAQRTRLNRRRQMAT